METENKYKIEICKEMIQINNNFLKRINEKISDTRNRINELKIIIDESNYHIKYLKQRKYTLYESQVNVLKIKIKIYRYELKNLQMIYSELFFQNNYYEDQLSKYENELKTYL